MGRYLTVARAKSKFFGRAMIASAIVLTAAAIALAAAGIGPSFTQVSGAGSISIPGASVEKGSLHFFSYRDDAGKDIRFVLGRDDSGAVHGAFDACQQCAQYRKGY